jgi:CRP-like cAMP-binding protein
MSADPESPRPIPGENEADGATVENLLLLNLPEKEWRTIYSQLVHMPLRIHDVLNEMAAPIKYAYFINSGLASVLNVMEDGKSVEVGLTGREGFVGLPLIVGFESSPSRVIVQIVGSGFRIGAKGFLSLLQKCPTLERRLHRYSQVLAEFLAHMLGTRRSSVTVAASILQKAGLIEYTRGQVNIVDRRGLEQAACECYRALVLQSSRWKDETRST